METRESNVSTWLGFPCCCWLCCCCCCWGLLGLMGMLGPPCCCWLLLLCCIFFSILLYTNHSLSHSARTENQPNQSPQATRTCLLGGLDYYEAEECYMYTPHHTTPPFFLGRSSSRMFTLTITSWLRIRDPVDLAPRGSLFLLKDFHFVCCLGAPDVSIGSLTHCIRFV